MESQNAVIELLESPATHQGRPVERIDTHASIVFLAGDRAWKLKRAVRYDYLDFSTRERRRTCCEAEVRLNRANAPGLYLGVVPVTREPGGALALGGTGDPVDWVVKMRRFDSDQQFDRLAAHDALPPALMPPLAMAVARAHQQAPRAQDYGGHAGMVRVVEGNAEGFRVYGAACLDSATCARVTLGARTRVADQAVELDTRQRDGLVRQCHGDLHLRNIVLLDGAPTLFDAIEFNDDLSCIDVLYDLSFLLMDLWRQLPGHANLVLNSYLAETLDFEGLSLLPLFLSCRAAVRAKTNATAATLEGRPAQQAALRQAARHYLDLAWTLQRPARPSLVAIGGWSGTGKSTMARRLAPRNGAAPGALTLRSDEVRKQLQGVSATTRLGPDAYAPDVSRRVYAALAGRAHVALRAGHSVIVDAVFADADNRSAVEHVAHTVGVPFSGVWLDAPEPVLIERVRQRQDDASDADADIVRQQVRTTTGAIQWQRIDASGSMECVDARLGEWLKVRSRP